MSKIIIAKSGHTLHVSSCDNNDMPKNAMHVESYDKLYVVRSFSESGVVFFYLGKGNKKAPKEIVVWYPNGQFWSGFGLTIKDAINGAQADGWMCAK